MTDPKIRQAILAANAADAAAAHRLEQLQISGEGAALALSQLPAFEMVELTGQLGLVQVIPGFAKIMLSGIGSTRAYTINLPVDWLRNVIAEHDKQHPADPPPEGEPDTVPGERDAGGQPIEEPQPVEEAA